MSHGGALPMARGVQSIKTEPLLASVKQPKQTGAKRCTAVHDTCQDDEEK